MALIKPSLVIGAGGSGYWILSLLKRQLYINYGINVDESKEVKFLLLDTLTEENFETKYKDHVKSIGEKFAIKRKEYLHLGEARGGFFSWAHQERNYSDPLYGWFRRKLFIENFPVEANWKLTEGAAQLREFGRMAFFFNKNRVKQAITNLLDEIKKVSRDATIPVWIFGSFAGGTGSGMMLDIAMLTKLIADQKGHAIRNIGGIVLPGVYKDRLQTSASQGYAAFRELSRFLSSTQEEHRANMDNRNCAHLVALDDHDKYYQNRYIFDNIVYFNEECTKDEDRKDYFNKITDGLTIFFDYSGAKDFFDEIINHKENRVTSISTYKIFIPINLYTQLFTASFLKEEIDKLFPNSSNSTIALPDDGNQKEIHRDINNFLNNVSPYFLGLAQLEDNDKKAREYTHENIIKKPSIIFNDLYGFSTPEKYFGEEVNSSNYRIKLEKLYKNIYEDKKIRTPDELKKHIKNKKNNEPDYTLNQYMAEFKRDIDKIYQGYENIFKKENEDRETIKDNITGHFKTKLKKYIKNDYESAGVSKIYYFLDRMVSILEGSTEGSGGIRKILNKIVKSEFDSMRAEMDRELNRISGDFSKIELVKDKKVLGIFSKETENYEGAVNLMKEYLSFRKNYLLFEQSENLISILIEIHDEFSLYVQNRVLKSLIDKNSEISIDRHSIKSSLSNQIVDIRSVMKGGIGKASSIGVLGTPGEVEKYENYLKDKIFAEKPFADLKVIFDDKTETFKVEYIDSDRNTWYDNQAIELSVDKKVTLWAKIIDDIYQNIDKTRLPQYEGIMHYLNWARDEYKEESVLFDHLEKKLLNADKFIKLVDKTPKSYRMIYGDKNAGTYNLENLLQELKTKLGNEVGTAVSDPTDSNKNIEFGDKNSLIFFSYSNEIMPQSIEVLKNMHDEYTKQISSRGSIDWRAQVYHNYKADWKMWEIERSLPDFKGKGLNSLTHGSFYWVLEEVELVKLFVNCVASGVIREEDGVMENNYWVCGPTGERYDKKPDEFYLITDEDKTSDMFTALVTFAVTKRQPGRIDDIDFENVRRILKKTLQNEKEKNKKNFNQLKEEYANNQKWIGEYNKQVDIDDYDGHMKLFLARIFWFFLKEEHKIKN